MSSSNSGQFVPIKQGEAYWTAALQYVTSNILMRPRFSIGNTLSSNPYPNSANGSLWTMPIEVLCYFLVVFIIDFYNLAKKHNKRLANGLIISLVVGAVVFNNYVVTVYADSELVIYGTDWCRALDLMVYFFIGVTFYLLQIYKYCNWQYAVVALAVWLMLLRGWLWSMLMPVIIGYSVLCFSQAEPPAFEKVFKRDVCYGLYLYAFPVQQIVIYILKVIYGFDIPVIYYFLISLVIIWSLAELSYAFVENQASEYWKRLEKQVR